MVLREPLASDSM